MEDLLYGKHLSKSYGGKDVLSEIELHIREGEFVSILGVSGVGKTTLLNLLSGLESPDEGSIFVRKDEGECEITGQAGKLGYMLQKDLLLPQKTTLDNVALPLQISGMTKKEARECAGLFFEKFGLKGSEKLYPAQLSGGMRQRAALLRTYLSEHYLHRSGLVLLDEPFSALDAMTREEIRDWYLRVAEKAKLATLLITHDVDEAIYLSDRIYILAGSPATIKAELAIEEPKPRSNDFLLTENFLSYKREVRAYLDKI